MPLDSEVIVVSGLPRSGTSLMMQMLESGGIPLMTDTIRVADEDNPRGYYEFERVKTTKADPSWVPQARGKAVKMVSSLLYDLPDTESYRIVFMQRDLDEVLRSQEMMLRRLGRAAPPIDQMRNAFTIHLDQLFRWLSRQSHMRVMEVHYNRLLVDPKTEVQPLSAFLDGLPATERMLSAIDAALYRNRNPQTHSGAC